MTARAAGITAVILASVSVCVGLLMSGPRKGGRDLRPVHETLAIATLVAIAVHGLSLIADPWLNPGVAGVLLPFTLSYRPAAVAAGIVGAYGLAVLGLTYYARSRIGTQRWKKLHRWTALFWALAVVHGFTAGTDRLRPWFIVSVGSVTLAALMLLAARTSERAAASRGAYAPAPR